VRTQVASSTPAERLPAIWGRATFTTVVSMISMKVPAITAMVINHLFTAGGPEDGAVCIVVL